MNVYFMRHGQTDWNIIKKIQGRTDIALNQKGIEEAEATSEGMHDLGIKFDLIYTSPLLRAVKTAQIMNVYSDAPLVKDKRIEEFDFGMAEGVTFEEIKINPKYEEARNWFFAPQNYKGDGKSESYEEFFGRIDSFLDDLKVLEKKRDDIKNLLIVCHGGVTRGILKEMLGLSVSKFAELQIPNCSVNKAVLKDGKFSIEYTAKVFWK